MSLYRSLSGRGKSEAWRERDIKYVPQVVHEMRYESPIIGMSTLNLPLQIQQSLVALTLMTHVLVSWGTRILAKSSELREIRLTPSPPCTDALDILRSPKMNRAVHHIHNAFPPSVIPKCGRRKKTNDLLRSSACTIKHVPEVSMTTYLRVTSAIASVLILAACAATTAAMKPKDGASALAQNPACLTQTGTRITSNGVNCTAIGRSYFSDDINRTGATTADEALRLLDPSITVHH
jgi:hypothetical protein